MTTTTTITTNDAQFAPFVEAFSEAEADMTEGAAEIACQSIKAYATGMKVLAQQQRLAYRALQQWVSGVTNVNTQLRQRLLEGYGAAGSELLERSGKSLHSTQAVVQRLASSRGQEPVPGYDELGVPEIQKLLADSDIELATRIRDYERPRKSREGVLRAADAQLSKS